MEVHLLKNGKKGQFLWIQVKAFLAGPFFFYFYCQPAKQAKRVNVLLSRVLFSVSSALIFFLRFNPRVSNSSTDEDVVCTGGDNSYGLIITEPDGEQHLISVNDSIIGRRSNPLIAKVTEEQQQRFFRVSSCQKNCHENAVRCAFTTLN